MTPKSEGVLTLNSSSMKSPLSCYWLWTILLTNPSKEIPFLFPLVLLESDRGIERGPFSSILTP